MTRRKAVGLFGRAGAEDEEVSDFAPLNDRQHTAFHEAGHRHWTGPDACLRVRYDPSGL